MFDLFLPLIIATAMGIEPERADEAGPEALADEIELALADQGSGDDLTADREPEPQVPTGKFTTAVEVRPILGMTKTNWVGVREYEGQDLVYFTHLMSWRCGLWDIRYGINGEPADRVVPMEPCYEETASPNAMTDVANFLPFTAHELQSVESIYVEIVFDDGTTDFARFDRNQVLIP